MSTHRKVNGKKKNSLGRDKVKIKQTVNRLKKRFKSVLQASRNVFSSDV